MLKTPSKHPIRAVANGRCRIKVAIRQDLYAVNVKDMLKQFGELAGFEPYSAHVILNPLFDPDEVIAYINSYSSRDCDVFREQNAQGSAELGSQPLTAVR